jgi:hypothetical protein
MRSFKLDGEGCWVAALKRSRAGNGYVRRIKSGGGLTCGSEGKNGTGR